MWLEIWKVIRRAADGRMKKAGGIGRGYFLRLEVDFVRMAREGRGFRVRLQVLVLAGSLACVLMFTPMIGIVDRHQISSAVKCRRPVGVGYWL